MPMPADADKQDISSRQLRCVVSLAQYGSFVAAATDLGMSQPALTRAIMRVEEILGVRLFTRSTRRVALTGAGREFVPVAERLLADLAISVQNMRALQTRERGRLVIACLMSVAYGVLPKVIADYHQRHRGVDLEIREGLLSTVIEDVRSGLVDFGIGDITNSPALPDAIEATPMREERFRVVLRTDHRLADRRRLGVKDLRDETVITMPFGAGMRRLIDGSAATAGISFGRTITVSQFATVFSLVRSGIGVSIVPEAALAIEPDAAIASRPLTNPTITRKLGLLRIRNRPTSPAAEGFLDLLGIASSPSA
jgi:DNA-binding transcriptional LysR family regulator